MAQPSRSPSCQSSAPARRRMVRMTRWRMQTGRGQIKRLAPDLSGPKNGGRKGWTQNGHQEGNGHRELKWSETDVVDARSAGQRITTGVGDARASSARSPLACWCRARPRRWPAPALVLLATPPLPSPAPPRRNTSRISTCRLAARSACPAAAIACELGQRAPAWRRSPCSIHRARQSRATGRSMPRARLLRGAPAGRGLLSVASSPSRESARGIHWRRISPATVWTPYAKTGGRCRRAPGTHTSGGEDFRRIVGALGRLAPRCRCARSPRRSSARRPGFRLGLRLDDPAASTESEPRGLRLVLGLENVAHPAPSRRRTLLNRARTFMAQSSDAVGVGLPPRHVVGQAA